MTMLEHGRRTGINIASFVLRRGWLWGPLCWALWISFPRESVPFHFDDWLFVDDLLRMPLAEAIVRPTGDHFLPAFKLVYGALLLLAHFDTWGALVFQFFVRAGSIALIGLLLRRVGAWRPYVALLLACLAFNEAGIRGVFRWGWELVLEQSLLLACLTLWLLDRYLAGGRRLAAVLMAFLGLQCTWSFGLGFAVLLAVPMALAIDVLLDRRLGCITPLRWVLPAGLCLLALALALPVHIAVLREATPHSSEFVRDLPFLAHPAEVASYFVYLTAANSALGGLRFGATPGWLNAAFLALTLLGLAARVRTEEVRRTRVLILALALIALGANGLTALTRWPAGLTHAGSYRYVYGNVFLQVPLLAIALATAEKYATERLAIRRRLTEWGATSLCLVLVWLAGTGGVAGLKETRQAERRRRECIDATLRSSTTPSCLGPLCGDAGGKVVRRVMAGIR